MSESENNFSFNQDFSSDEKVTKGFEVSVERLNELLYGNNISSQEHSFLLQKLYPVEKQISTFAWLCLVTAVVSWISFLTFSYGEAKFELMSGANRFRVISVLAPLAIAFFYFAYREIRTKQDIKGFNIALIGAAIAMTQLTIIIPTWLMYLHLMIFE